MGKPHVIACVLTWNEYTDTKSCLASLQAQTYDNLDVVLVDNNSTDGSIDRLRKEFPTVTIIENDRNLGFSLAQNKAIEHGLDQGADYLWVLNNDIVLPDHALEHLVAEIGNDPTIGMITPQIMDDEATWFSYGQVNRRSGHINAGPLARLRRAIAVRNTGQRFIDNDYAPLCCLLVDADVFRAVGLLPDPYFIYTEDVEFCLRAREAGYRIVTDTELTVDHAASSSSGGEQNPVTNYYVARNRWILQRRTDSIRLHRFLPTYTLWLWKRAALALVKQRPDGCKALIEGTIDGARNHTGKGRYP